MARASLNRPYGPKLVYEIHSPAAPARAAVLVSHGYAEHAGRYDKVVRGWTARGLLVATYDLRGHGHSEGPRGHIEAFDDYLDDCDDILRELETKEEWKTLGRPVLFGHSLGGLIASHVALRHPGRFRGLAVTSPFFGLKMQVPAVQRIAGKIVSRMFGRLRQPSKLKGEDLTHDTELSKSYDSDPFHFGHVTVRWFVETEEAQRRLLEAAPSLDVPFFCLAAGDDRVASTAATRRLYERIGSADKEFVELPGLYHEVLNELDSARHIETLANRMLGWRE